MRALANVAAIAGATAVVPDVLNLTITNVHATTRIFFPITREESLHLNRLHMQCPELVFRFTVLANVFRILELENVQGVNV